MIKKLIPRMNNNIAPKMKTTSHAQLSRKKVAFMKEQEHLKRVGLNKVFKIVDNKTENHSQKKSATQSYKRVSKNKSSNTKNLATKHK